MKQSNLIRIIAGVVLFLIGFVAKIAGNVNDVGLLTILSGGASMIIVGLLKHNKYGGGVERDERSKKISYTALAASFQLCLMGLILFWWVNYLNPLSLSLSDFIGLVMFGMITLALLTRLYFEKRGVDL